jgi:uncharacterized RDD family membrane protein YckC
MPIGPELVVTIIFGVFSLLVYFVINGRMLKNRGQSLGKRLLNIAIVRTDGQPAGMNLLLRRYTFMYGLGAVPVVGTIIGLVDVFSIFRKTRRCLHDQLADTVVVKRL